MHPYVKYQKARIYTILKDTHVLDYNLAEKIKSSYQDCIWIIKTNNMFSSIRKTKTYASILWLFGMQLNDLKSDKLEIVKYLEESCDVFDEINVGFAKDLKCIFCTIFAVYSPYFA